ncbi:hypothetical protein BC826DRAFT_976589 [Russula brevipes]|nr:hypothetical protein BC826DRAFT_976589 [Russula brevipes]
MESCSWCGARVRPVRRVVDVSESLGSAVAIGASGVACSLAGRRRCVSERREGDYVEGTDGTEVQKTWCAPRATLSSPTTMLSEQTGREGVGGRNAQRDEQRKQIIGSRSQDCVMRPGLYGEVDWETVESEWLRVDRHSVRQHRWTAKRDSAMGKIVVRKNVVDGECGAPHANRGLQERADVTKELCPWVTNDEGESTERQVTHVALKAAISHARQIGCERKEREDRTLSEVRMRVGVNQSVSICQMVRREETIAKKEIAERTICRPDWESSTSPEFGSQSASKVEKIRDPVPPRSILYIRRS